MSPVASKSTTGFLTLFAILVVLLILALFAWSLGAVFG